MIVLARLNPFRSERIEALPFRDGVRLGDAAAEPLLARFEALGRRGLLVGPHGSGKTTLREALERLLVARGWRVRSLVLAADRAIDRSALVALTADASPRDVLSIDGIDRLGWWSWRRVLRAADSAGGVLATSHAPGRLPLLLEHRTSPGLLRELVAELVDAETAERSSERCEALFARHRGDLRACLRVLYDDHAIAERSRPDETSAVAD